MANRIRLMVLAVLCLLVVPIAIACFPGERCIPWLSGYVINPCNTYSVNRSSPISVTMAPSGCPQGALLPDVVCKAGVDSLKIQFWKIDTTFITNPLATSMAIIDQIDVEALATCVRSHWTTYCDDISTKVTVYINNGTIAYDTGWSAFTYGYMGQEDRNVVTYNIGDLTPGWNWTASEAQIELKVRTTNDSENAYEVRFNYTIVDDGPIHYGMCVLTETTPPEFKIEDNRWTNTFRSFGILGANAAYTLFVVIVCGAIFLAAGTKGRGKDFNMAAGMTLAVAMLLIIIGAFLKIINWMPIAVFLIIVSVAIIKRIRKAFIS